MKETFRLKRYSNKLPPYGHSGGRSSVLREMDGYSNGGGRHIKNCIKQQDEEIEACRALFGFSAKEIITTQNYVEVSDLVDDSFNMSPFGDNKPCMEPFPETELTASKCSGHSNGGIHPLKMGDDRLLKSIRCQVSKRYLSGQLCLNAVIEYRRARSLKDAHGILARRHSPSFPY